MKQVRDFIENENKGFVYSPAHMSMTARQVAFKWDEAGWRKKAEAYPVHHTNTFKDYGPKDEIKSCTSSLILRL